MSQDRPESVAEPISFEPVGRDEEIVRALYAEFIAEADGPLGIDLEAEIAAGPAADAQPPDGALLLARVDGEPAGLAGIRRLDTDVAEVKSLYVVPAHRGRGVARLALAELERIAVGRGCRAVNLDTSDYLTAAISLYRSSGYREVEPFNSNPKASLWFEKRLSPG